MIVPDDAILNYAVFLLHLRFQDVFAECQFHIIKDEMNGSGSLPGASRFLPVDVESRFALVGVDGDGSVGTIAVSVSPAGDVHHGGFTPVGLVPVEGIFPDFRSNVTIPFMFRASTSPCDDMGVQKSNMFQR